jgi:hypothetical protein
LYDATQKELKIFEDEILAFAAHLHYTMGRKAETIKQKYFAIRYEHVKVGLADPIKGRVRLWMLLNAIRKRDGPLERRWPVTTKMLIRLYRKLDIRGARHLVIWVTLLVMWFFLLRASEAVGLEDEVNVETTKALRGCDLELRCGAVPIHWVPGRKAGEGQWQAKNGGQRTDGPTSLTILIHTSKTDKFSGGSARTHRRSGRAPFCPVDAVARLMQAFPERFDGEKHLPVFRWEDGSRVTRENIKHWVRYMVVSEGLPARRGNSHSLRIGGATALYAATRDIEVVRRWGRWLGDIAHLYAWDERQASNEDAARMASSSGDIVAFAGERLA